MIEFRKAGRRPRLRVPVGKAVIELRAGRLQAVQPILSRPRPRLETFMSQYQIAVLVGSLRRDSFNRKLANAVVKLAAPEFSFKQVQIGDLPLYNQDDDAY